ncbi:MAG TPA: hypothetical protein VK908_06730 [Jiangellales bacterium]|nr:hypothetical protein [Jiangellales bacterium]
MSGLGGVPGVYGTWYHAEYGHVWTFMGFPTYSDGTLFVSAGLDTSVPLLAAFVVVCVVEVVLGVLLWMRRWSGAALSLALLPLEFAFWIGFGVAVWPGGRDRPDRGRADVVADPREGRRTPRLID